jgi:hypothetical protein
MNIEYYRKLALDNFGINQDHPGAFSLLEALLPSVHYRQMPSNGWIGKFRISCFDRKSTSGARTILILEEDDIFLTNHFNVVDALIEVEASSANRPDEVYLLSVFTSMWLITRLRLDDRTLYDLPVDERFWETHPASLVNVTGERRAPKQVATQ